MSLVLSCVIFNLSLLYICLPYVGANKLGWGQEVLLKKFLDAGPCMEWSQICRWFWSEWTTEDIYCGLDACSWKFVPFRPGASGSWEWYNSSWWWGGTLSAQGYLPLCFFDRLSTSSISSNQLQHVDLDGEWAELSLKIYLDLLHIERSCCWNASVRVKTTSILPFSNSSRSKLFLFNCAHGSAGRTPDRDSWQQAGRGGDAWGNAPGSPGAVHSGPD